MNKLKSSLSLALNTHFRRTILINDEKAKKQLTLVLNTHILNSSICGNLLILTARLHNLLAKCIFEAHLCVNDK